MIQPFAHEDLEMKQEFLKSARNFKDKMGDSVENEFTTALLYMNLADYLAEYLVVGLNAMMGEAMSKYYLGMVKVRPPKRDKLTIGDSIHQLQRFDFAGKAEILETLITINGARQKIAHQILKIKPDKVQEIDEAARILVESTEQLVDLVDTLSLGMPPKTLLQRFEELHPSDESAEESVKSSKKSE
jgi:hypothetical protein